MNKLLEDGVKKLCELKFSHPDNSYGYINVGWDRAGKKCKCRVCKETMSKGELRIWDFSEHSGRRGGGYISYYHPECFFAVFIERMMSLEDERVGKGTR